jgi:hypothetical protein
VLVQSAAELRAMVNALATHEVTIGAATVPIIFEAAGQRMLGLVDSTEPTATLVADDWSGVARGSTVTIGGTAYTVIGVEPDGAGLVTVRLQA